MYVLLFLQEELLESDPKEPEEVMEQDEQQAVPLPQVDAGQQDAILRRPVLAANQRQPVLASLQQRPILTRRQRQQQHQRKAGIRGGRQHNPLEVDPEHPKKGWFCAR